MRATLAGVTLRLEDGRTIDLEGGHAMLVKTTTNGQATARLEVSVSVEARWVKGEGGRFISTEVTL